MAGTEPLSPTALMVRRSDHDRFLTALFAPAERRDALYALYAFNYEVAKTRELVSEKLLGRMRLQWWRESLDAIYAGAAIRRHEVVVPLAEAIRAHGLPRAGFDRLLEAREGDLDDTPPADMAALEAYADATSGELLRLALAVLGVRDAAASDAGSAVGIAFALAGLLRAMPVHARVRRLYLPADRLAAAGIDLERTIFALKSSPALASVVAAVAERARTLLAAARSLRRQVPRAALPALLPGILTERALDRLARAGHDVFAPRLLRPEGGTIVRLALASFRGRY